MPSLWDKIVNTAKKIFQVSEKTFMVVEPYAVTALALSGHPEASAVVGTVYGVVQNTEINLANQPGATKFQAAQSAIQTAGLPLLTLALNTAGKTMDVGSVDKAIADTINAVVAENNAQSALQTVLSTASASGKPIDPTVLANAQANVSKASALVMQAGTEITAAIKTVSTYAVTK